MLNPFSYLNEAFTRRREIASINQLGTDQRGLIVANAQKNRYLSQLQQQDQAILAARARGRSPQVSQPSQTLVGGASTAPTNRTTPYWNDINTVSKNRGINPKFLDSLVLAESSYNPAATSKTGAYGLTQLQPTTLQGLGYTGKPQDLTPLQQIDYGAQYANNIYGQRQKVLGVSRALTPLEWYHAYSFGPNTTQPISPAYESNWNKAYNRY